MHNRAMSPARKHSSKLTLGVILFLVGQLFSLAHASEFGSDPHEHNGVACVAILTDEHDGLTPATNLNAVGFNLRTFTPSPILGLPPLVQPRATRPPATGPPSI